MGLCLHFTCCPTFTATAHTARTQSCHARSIAQARLDRGAALTAATGAQARLLWAIQASIAHSPYLTPPGPTFAPLHRAFTPGLYTEPLHRARAGLRRPDAPRAAPRVLPCPHGPETRARIPLPHICCPARPCTPPATPSHLDPRPRTTHGNIRDSRCACPARAPANFFFLARSLARTNARMHACTNARMHARALHAEPPRPLAHHRPPRRAAPRRAHQHPKPPEPVGPHAVPAVAGPRPAPARARPPGLPRAGPHRGPAARHLPARGAWPARRALARRQPRPSPAPGGAGAARPFARTSLRAHAGPCHASRVLHRASRIAQAARRAGRIASHASRT